MDTNLLFSFPPSLPPFLPPSLPPSLPPPSLPPSLPPSIHPYLPPSVPPPILPPSLPPSPHPSLSQDGTDLSDKDLPPLSLVDAVTTHYTLAHREAGKGVGGEEARRGATSGTDDATKKGKEGTHNT